MYKELSNTITTIVEFTNKHRIDAIFHMHSVGDLQGENGIPNKYWAKFEKKSGVYVLLKYGGELIHYVGMSENDTGTRLYNWLFKENKINNVITPSDLVLSVVLENQSYMSPALESYLITKLKPALNIRNNKHTESI